MNHCPIGVGVSWSDSPAMGWSVTESCRVGFGISRGDISNYTKQIKKTVQNFQREIAAYTDLQHSLQRFKLFHYEFN